VDDTEFLREAYQVILGRPPDLDSWLAVRRLLDVGLPKNLIVYQLAGSAEVRDGGRTIKGAWVPRPIDEILALDGSAFVREAFRSLLWREPDTASLETYVAQRRQGRLRREILREIALSAEAELLPREARGLDVLVKGDHAPSGDDFDQDWSFLGETGEDLVRGAYRTVLRRDPEPAGLAHWLLELAQGRSGSELLLELVDSPEAQALAADQSSVAQLHAHLRSAATSGFQPQGGRRPAPNVQVPGVSRRR
jgi:hypothetical protein